jgi:hypothetical protein
MCLNRASSPPTGEGARCFGFVVPQNRPLVSAFALDARQIHALTLARLRRGDSQPAHSGCRRRGAVGHVGPLDSHQVHQHHDRDNPGDFHDMSGQPVLCHPHIGGRPAAVLLQLVALPVHGDRRPSAAGGICHAPTYAEVDRGDLTPGQQRHSTDRPPIRNPVSPVLVIPSRARVGWPAPRGSSRRPGARASKSSAAPVAAGP